MIEKIKYLMSKKAFHLCVVIVIISIVLFTLGIILLKYSVEGETNLPFKLKKIIIISSSEGIDKQSEGNKWAFDINQNNDIYFYIEKNRNYGKQEIIKSVLINNINVEKEKKENIKFYKPNTEEKGGIFNNIKENEIQTIEYLGGMETDLKNLKISNQGGLIAFRYSNEKIAEYISNDEVINHNELLKKAEVKEEILKTKLNLDFTLKMESGKEYKASISLEMPVEGIVEKGTTSREITDLTNIVFKRVKK